MSAPDHTPWGHADHKEQVAEGIWFVSTPSHGGFWLDRERNAKVPANWRAISFNGQADAAAGWYEEDCDWCMVVLTFPEHFPANEVVEAQQSFDHWHKPKLEGGR